MSENKSSGGGGNFLIGLALGAIAGAAIYFYLDETPEGKKKIKEIKDESKDALSHLTEIVEDLEVKKAEIAQKTERIGKELEAKIIEAKKEITIEAEAGLSQIEKLQARGRKFAKFFTRGGKPVSKTV